MAIAKALRCCRDHVIGKMEMAAFNFVSLIFGRRLLRTNLFVIADHGFAAGVPDNIVLDVFDC